MTSVGGIDHHRGVSDVGPSRRCGFLAVSNTGEEKVMVLLFLPAVATGLMGHSSQSRVGGYRFRDEPQEARRCVRYGEEDAERTEGRKLAFRKNGDD